MSELADQLLDDVESIASNDDDPHHLQTPVPESLSISDSDNVPARITHLLPPAVKETVLPLLRSLATKSSITSIPAPTEYELVTRCLTAITTIDDNIQKLHAYLKKAFKSRFPELETLVFQPLDYARVAHLTAASNDLTKLDLRSILPSASVISINLAFASTAGDSLTQEQLEKVYTLCDTLLKLDEWRTTLLAFVEKGAERMAPNLVAVVGGSVAARLMALAGGLEALASMPSGYAKLLGKQNTHLQGTSSATTRRHEGIMFTCPLVTNLPPSIRSKAGEILSGKACLAARVDSCRSSTDGSMGRMWRQKLEERYTKWLEPAPARTLKPLPKPGDETKRKHRGGRRARMEKEKLGLTEARKLANRVKFGKEEVTVGNELDNEGLGMLAVEGSGPIRVRVKTTQHLSAAAKKRLEKQKQREKRSEAEELGITGENLLLLKANQQTRGSTSVSDAKENGKKVSYFSSAAPFVMVDKDRQTNTKNDDILVNGNDSRIKRSTKLDLGHMQDGIERTTKRRKIDLQEPFPPA